MNLLNSIKAKWTIFGIAFGSLFPIAATLLQIQWMKKTLSMQSILQAQVEEPILWIVDMAPFVLGIVFNLVGKREHDLQKTYNRLVSANQQRSELYAHLEELVEERTAELAIASERANKHAKQFETVTDLAYSLASITDLQTLLEQTTQMVSERLGYYHVGIFLLDDTREFAILKAANSVGGHKMLARGHRLRVGSEGIVGYITSRGEPRIAEDVGSDAAFFDNPDLPDTRSEVALPLKYGEIVFGALDIQSTEQNAFSRENISILKVLTNLLSIVIQNSYSLEQAHVAIAQSESATRQLTGQAWSNFISYTPATAYWFDGIKARALIQQKNDRPLEDQKDVISVPIRLRGETIGKLSIKPPSVESQWTNDEMRIIQATAESVALSAENARLIAESQKRASKEQIIGDISTKIGSSVNLRNVLQTAVEELGRNIPGSEIVIELNSRQEQADSSVSGETK